MPSASALRAAALLGLIAACLARGGAAAPGDAAWIGLATAAVALAAGAWRREAPCVPRDAALLALAWLAVGGLSLLWSQAPDATLDRLAARTAGCLVFLLAAGLLERRPARIFAGGLALLAAATAAVALASFGEGERARAPFANPNHLASWLLLPAGFAWVGMGKPHPGQDGGRRGLLPGFAALGVIGAAVAASGSRGAGLAAAAALGGVALVRRLGPRRGVPLAAAGLVAGVLALAVLPVSWPGGLSVARGGEESSAGLRWSLYAATARIALDAGPLGVGLGAFPAAFDAHRPAGVPYSPRFAHSEPLQGLAELGVAFVALGLLTLWIGAGRLRRTLRTHSRLTWGALAALLAVVAHALVDFPLQVPAIGLSAAAVAGLLFREPSPDLPPLAPGRSRALLAGLALLLAGLAGTGVVAVSAERRAAAHLAEGDFARAARAAGQGLAVRPWRAELWTLLADAAEHEARYAGGGRRAMARAAEARRRAVTSRPRDGALRRRAARTLARAGRPEAAERALAEAARLDPHSPASALARGRLALGRGDRAGAAAALREALALHPRARGSLLPAALRAGGDPALLQRIGGPDTTVASLLARSGFAGDAARLLEELEPRERPGADRALRAARLYRRAGLHPAARRVLERARSRHPDDGRVRRALARLEVRARRHGETP